MTILREAELAALRSVELSGKVLDLGGEKRSDYSRVFGGSFVTTTVNVAPGSGADIIADLEQPLPIEAGSYDGVLLLNVLEHIFEYRALLGETARVLKRGGQVVIVVPYLFPHHPSPSDFHRYSAEALRRSLEASDFSNIKIKALGTGVFAARYLMLERLLPGSVQQMIGWLTHPLARLADWLFTNLARALGKQYDPADYALGYLATATKA